VCLHMHAPRDAHWAAVKRILRYVCGTMGYGLSLHASPSTSTDLVAYSDADWAGCPDTRRSTSGYCVYLGSSLVSWSSKRQPTVSRSSAEAEYRVVANAVAECTWLRQLLSELSCPVDKATVVFCDNVSAVYLSANPVHHRRTKHIELDIHFVRVRGVPAGGAEVEAVVPEWLLVAVVFSFVGAAPVEPPRICRLFSLVARGTFALAKLRRTSPPPPTPRRRAVGFKRSYYFRCPLEGEVDVVFINNRTCDRVRRCCPFVAPEPIVIKIFYALLQAASERLPQQQEPPLVGFGISSRVRWHALAPSAACDQKSIAGHRSEGSQPAAALGSSRLYSVDKPLPAGGFWQSTHFWHARWDNRLHQPHRHLHLRWRTPVTYEELPEELKKKYNEIKATLEADLIGSFQRTRSHGIRWKGFSPEGALDGIDLSAPSEERTRGLRQEINYLVAHSLHRHSENLVNVLERVALRVIQEIMSHQYSPSGPALGTHQGELPLQSRPPLPYALAAPAEVPATPAFVVYKIGGDPSDYQFLAEAPKEIPQGYACTYVPDCGNWALSNQATTLGAPAKQEERRQQSLRSRTWLTKYATPTKLRASSCVGSELEKQTWLAKYATRRIFE
ncbi:hypothetical protein QYE76_057154, partial [Lolium multiflorum]